MALSLELEQSLKGKRIDNVYQPRPELFIIKLRPNGSDLLIEAGKRVHLTKYQYAIPGQPSGSCIAFRKRMKGSRIEKVYQPGFERILILDLERSDSKRHVIAEFFQKGNLIIADQSWKIDLPLRRVVTRDRRIVKGEEYRQPPPSPSDPFAVTVESLQKIRELGRVSIVRALTKYLGIGGIYSEEILSRAKIPKDIGCEQLSSDDLSAIHKAIKDLVKPFLERELFPVVVVDGKKAIDVAPSKLSSHEKLDLVQQPTFSAALDEFYARGYREGPDKTEFQRKLEEAERILVFQRDKLTELRILRERKKRIGDLIYAHYDEFNRGLKGGGDNPRVRIDPRSKTASIEIDDLKFSLKTDEELVRQAANFYDESKKIQTKINGLVGAIEETKSKLELLAQESEARPNVGLKEKVQKKWYEKFRWFRSSHGFLILAGKDASSNEVLLKKYTEKNDLVLHSDIQGASFVVIKSEGRQIDEGTVREAAEVAASYSKAWSQGLSAVDVGLMEPEQLSKTAPAGQFLPRGAFSVKGQRKVLRAVPLVVGIGLSLDQGVEVVGGPTHAVQLRTANYVEVVPGKIPSLELARTILARLVSRVPDKSEMKSTKALASDVQNFIPSGKGELKR